MAGALLMAHSHPPETLTTKAMIRSSADLTKLHAGDHLPMNGAGAAAGPLKIPTARVVWALVAAAFVLTPIGAITYQLFWLRSWHGDIPAVVDRVSGSRVNGSWVDDHYSVEFAGTSRRTPWTPT